MIYSKGRIDMATIFPREEKAEMLFDKILANPEACRRLKRTFYDAIDSGDEFVTESSRKAVHRCIVRCMRK